MFISAADLLDKIQCGIICEWENQTKTFAAGSKAAEEFRDYTVQMISVKDGKIVLQMEKNGIISNDVNEEWVKAYIGENGETPVFF